MADPPLFDGDRGGQARDAVDIRFGGAVEELSCIGTQGLNVAALAFRIQRIEGKGAFPRARYAGEYNQAVLWQAKADIAQIVLSCAADLESIHAAFLSSQAGAELLRDTRRS